MRTLKQINADIRKVSDEFREKHNALIAEKIEATKNGHTYTGVPYHLHALILKWTGNDFLPGCGCEKVMDDMEEWGPDGCREHLDEIVAKMHKEAKKRGWTTGLMVSVPIASRVGMRAMVLYAIRLAEKETINSKE